MEFFRQEYSSGLLQGNFPTQGSNPGLLHYRQMIYRLSHQASPNPKTHKIKQQQCKQFKVKPELYFLHQTYDTSLQPVIISRPPKLQFEVSPVEGKHCLGPFPNWDSRLLLLGTSQHAVSEWILGSPIWWCMCYYSSLLFPLLYSVNDCILKLSNPLLNTEIVYLCVMGGFFC